MKKIFVYVQSQALRGTLHSVLELLQEVVFVADPDNAQIVLTDRVAPFKHLVGKKPILVLHIGDKRDIPPGCVSIRIANSMAQITSELAKVEPLPPESVSTPDKVRFAPPPLENMLRILVVENNPVHIQAAHEQLAGHDYKVVGNFEQAYENITQFYFQVVLTDLMMKMGGTCNCIGEKGEEHIFIESGYGFAIAWLALSRGVMKVAVLSDGSHHDHPMCFAMDGMEKTLNIGRATVIFSNSCLNDVGAKDWAGYLKMLTG